MTSRALAAQVVAPKPAKKEWPADGTTGPCWSCDAPDSPRHDCDSGHYVFACEEQCRIVDKVNPVGPSHRSRTVPRMTWEDCPLCQAEVNEAMAKQDRLADLKDRHDADAFDREYDR